MQKLWLFITVFFFSWFFFASNSSAATYTVCASGCYSTTITDAKNAATTPGDVISVQASYAPAGETYPINIGTASTTLTCSAGAIIGQTTSNADNTLQLTTSSTVSGCTFSNIKLYTGSGAYRSGIIIADNTFAAAASSTIELSSSIGHLSVLRNTNLDGIRINATSTDVLIADNTFYGDIGLNSSGLLLNTTGTSTRLTVQNNVFESRISAISGSNYKLLYLESDSLTFTTNTVRYISTPPSAIVATAHFALDGGSTHVFSGNKMESQPKTAGDTSECGAMLLFPISDMTQTISIRLRQNTFRNRCDAGNLFALGTSGKSSVITMFVSSTRNIFYAERASSKGAMQFDQNPSSVITGTLDQNLVYGSFQANRSNVGGTSVEAGSNYYTVDPHLQLSDASTANDLDVAPYSLALNIDGAGSKIGASTTTRRTTVYVDDNGTIDYSTVDATSLSAVSSTLRSGDTLSVAAGSYGSFSLNSTYATTSLALVGAGVSTIISADTNQNGISLSGVTSTSISGFVLQNASSTQSSYTSTLMNFTYGGNSYADAIVELGTSANQTIFINDADLNSATTVAADGDSVNNATGMGTENYHLVLVSIGGSRTTFLVPNSVFSSSADATAYWGGFGITIDRFVTNTFAVSGGVYTYNSAAVAAALVTLNGGLSTPAISQTTSYYGGIKLTSSGGITISSVTSTGNGYGIWFASGGGNRIYDSVLSSSLLYDIRHDASVTNTIDNVTFTRASSTVTGGAGLLVKFRARAQTRRAANTATVLSGSTVSATDAATTETGLGATGADGYTSFTRLPAYTITSVANSLTNGGYNAYTFAAGSITGYSGSSTTATLSSRDQTVTIDLVSSVRSTAPSSATAGSISATGASLGWTDNSDDETSFTINYVTTTVGEALGVDDGTTVTAATDATSASVTLYPNMRYQFRVAAVNGIGTSAYATSSAFRTLAATPGTPTVTAASRTTATIALDANNNSTTTEYHVYNSTLGVYVSTSTGSTSATPSWGTTSTWSGVTITDLTCGTSYSFAVIARNDAGTLTATSTAATVTTSACATVSSGGGGGGGGGVGSGASIPYIPLTTVPVVPSPAPVVVLPPIIVADIPQPVTTPVPATPVESVLPPASAATVRTLQTDARSFGVTLGASDQARLASFVENGTSEETRALGSGERRALVRDALQTMGRSDVPLADLERMARGEIPTTRNITREREQLPRVRSTFRTIYGRDPNFKNNEENLVWNTLMYRIRFERDLSAEREGIQDFRRLFNRAPQDPFQWATVRALGYVL